MALSKQEIIKINQLKNGNRVLNTAEDGKLLADALQKSLNIEELSDILSTNLTAVPASFATLADVQTYLDTVILEIESRLDDIETKLNQVLNA